MIRATLALMIALCLAAGIGWLGEAGIAPLVLVHEGEQVVVRGPGDRVQRHDSPGRVAFRVPLLSSSRRYDTRLQVLELAALPLPGRDDGLDVVLWWKIEDVVRFGLAWPETEDAELALAAHLTEAFSNALLAAGPDTATLTASFDTLLLDAGAESLRDKGVAMLGVRALRRPGAALLAAMRVDRETSRSALRREVAELASRLSADARRGAAQIQSTAERDAEITRGQAEAEAARIYAEAHSEAPEFYAFSRRLEAYRNTLGPNTTLVLPPDHDFFRLLSPASEAGP